MDVKEMTNEELISNGRAIIATGGLMDKREKEIMSELADRLETMSDKMEKLDRYVRQYGAEL